VVGKLKCEIEHFGFDLRRGDVKKNEIEAERCNCNLKCRFSFFRGCILR
jgi:hypothetical protein